MCPMKSNAEIIHIEAAGTRCQCLQGWDSNCCQIPYGNPRGKAWQNIERCINATHTYYTRITIIQYPFHITTFLCTLISGNLIFVIKVYYVSMYIHTLCTLFRRLIISFSYSIKSLCALSRKNVPLKILS